VRPPPADAGRRRSPVEDGVEDRHGAGPDGEEREGGRGDETERLPLRRERGRQRGGVEERDVGGVEDGRRGALEAGDVRAEAPPAPLSGG